jgi:hypothetical protein
MRQETLSISRIMQHVSRAGRAQNAIRLIIAAVTYIKSGICLSDEHLLTKAQNANPFRHDVVMLSTLTFV